VVGKGKPGQRLTKQVTISTKESRFVYAHAWGNQDWVKPGPAKAQGNTVTIPVQIEVPPRPGETLQAEVRFEGNGRQQFVVPVTLTVAAVSREEQLPEPEEPSGRRPLVWILAGVGALLLAVTGVGALILSGGEDDPNTPPIETPNPPPQPVAKNEA